MEWKLEFIFIKLVLNVSPHINKNYPNHKLTMHVTIIEIIHHHHHHSHTKSTWKQLAAARHPVETGLPQPPLLPEFARQGWRYQNKDNGTIEIHINFARQTYKHHTPNEDKTCLWKWQFSFELKLLYWQLLKQGGQISLMNYHEKMKNLSDKLTSSLFLVESNICS